MSLVIARVASDIGFLVADTLLSFELDLPDRNNLVSGENHALKIHILNPDTAIGFAGSVETSLTLIKTLSGELELDSSLNVCERLFSLYKQLIAEKKDQKPPECDFLVLQLTTNGRRLASITNEKITYCQSAYIGDPEEYKKMMALRCQYHPPANQIVQQPDGTFHTVPLVVSDGEKEFVEIAGGLEKLTSQRRSRTVGAICGCVTRVVDARRSRKLEYLQSVQVSLSAAEGHSGFSFLASNTGTRGVGIYYVSGKMGFLFVVGDSEHSHKEPADTVAQFIEVGRAKYGLNLE